MKKIPSKDNSKSCKLQLLAALIIMLFVIFIIIVLTSIAIAKCPPGKDFISRVIDGDTVEMLNKDKIRILGIDTYDYNKRMAAGQSKRTGYSIKEIKLRSKQATVFATEKLLNKCVTLKKDYKDKGRYQRLLRYINVDGRDYGLEAIKAGHANVYCGDKKVKKYSEYLTNSNFKCSK